MKPMKKYYGLNTLQESQVLKEALMTTTKVESWFVLSSGCILLITGLAKFVSAFGGARILNSQDPIFGISFRYLMLITGILEICISYRCITKSAHRLSLGLLAWLATCFVIYRIGILTIGWQKPCSCLGSMTELLHISPDLANRILEIIIAYLLIGSYAFSLFRCKCIKNIGAGKMGSCKPFLNLVTISGRRKAHPSESKE
jgi:hypothetical protein